MRSVVVVLPASMWAMMPMFLQRSNGTVLGTIWICSFWGSLKSAFSVFGSSLLACANSEQHRLPAIVREGLVSFSHTVHVFFLFDGRAAIVGRVKQFVAQLVDHALLA